MILIINMNKSIIPETVNYGLNKPWEILIIAIKNTDIIKFMNPATISLLAKASFLATPTIAEIANGNTIVAVMKFI